MKKVDVIVHHRGVLTVTKSRSGFLSDTYSSFSICLLFYKLLKMFFLTSFYVFRILSTLKV